MNGTIEITVKTVPGGKILTNVRDKKCSEEEALAVMTAACCAMVSGWMRDIPQKMRRKACEEFGQEMEQTVLEMVSGSKHAPQRFEGRDAAFISELMKRQGEVQEV